MKRIFTILVLFISVVSFSQKIKLKKGDVLVDEIVWLKYKGFNGFDKSIYNLNGDEIIFIKFVKNGPDNMIFSRVGDPNYFEISFLGLNKKIEIRNFEKEIITIIFESKAVNEDGTLNPDKIDRLVEKYGTQFSDKLKNTSTNTNTVIIKEEPRRSGININRGR